VGNDPERAERFYNRFSEILRLSGADVRVSIGNHDRFWHSEGSKAEHGTGLFRRFFGNPYFDYDHKGVHFIHLNTAEVCEGKYCVSDEQKKWLADLLAGIGPAKPLVVIGHVPFLSYYYPALDGVFTDKDMFANFKEIWDMLRTHNLQLILQGHQHLYEEINVLGTQFITGGAVSAGWWGGAFHGTEEGFVHVKWDGQNISWEYVDYGWEVK
jgi:3',5'-cyclic AMP phosphodiesterase CpdA